MSTKKNNSQNYYAVKRGLKPGIYSSWDECKAQINNFSGAIFKKFKTLEAAQDFLKNDFNDNNVNLNDNDSKLLDSEVIKIYIDGSYNKQFPDEFTSAFIIILNNAKVYEAMYRFKNKKWAQMRNVAGEILSCLASLEHMIKNIDNYNKDKKIKRIQIYHDYIGIAKWINGEWKRNKEETNTYFHEFTKLKSQYFRNYEITFVHVKSHSGNKWNDYVDSLAKKAFSNIEYDPLISNYISRSWYVAELKDAKKILQNHCDLKPIEFNIGDKYFIINFKDNKYRINFTFANGYEDLFYFQVVENNADKVSQKNSKNKTWEVNDHIRNILQSVYCGRVNQNEILPLNYKSKLSFDELSKKLFTKLNPNLNPNINKQIKKNSVIISWKQNNSSLTITLFDKKSNIKKILIQGNYSYLWDKFICFLFKQEYLSLVIKKIEQEKINKIIDLHKIQKYFPKKWKELIKNNLNFCVYFIDAMKNIEKLKRNNNLMEPLPNYSAPTQRLFVSIEALIQKEIMNYNPKKSLKESYKDALENNEITHPEFTKIIWALYNSDNTRNELSHSNSHTTFIDKKRFYSIRKQLIDAIDKYDLKFN